MYRTPAILTAAAFVAVTAAPVHARQSTDAPPSLVHADSALLNGAFDSAAAEYRRIVARSPEAAVAWYHYGIALERSGKRNEAVDAYAHASQFDSQRMGAEVGLTRLFVQQGNTPVALEHLRRLAALGADPATLDRMPALAPLRALPEYAEIRRLAEEKRYPCRNVHTFDFWAGDFNAAPWNSPPGTPGGQLHNTRDYEGCAITEHWMPAPGGGPAGMSVAYYDTERKAWRFVWIDDNNGSIQFEGSYRDGAMRFEATFTTPDGKKALARNVLQDISPDTVRHTYSESTDGGRTWTVQGDDRFVRRKPQPTP